MTKNNLKVSVIMSVLAGLLAIGMARPARAVDPTANWSRVTIDGAGASFPFPLYSLWAYNYEEVTGLKVNYQSVGSGAGIAAIQGGTVDFGASDAPLTEAELDQSGLIQFPMIIGGVVPVVNIAGVEAGQLRLTPDILADIFLGNITNWSDQRIKAANPGLNLPRKAIVVVHRADGSGTTWIFTSYLDKVSTQWHDRVGAGKSVEWPSTGVGGRGNEGVANYVAQVDGSIGYVEYAYALQNDLSHTLLRNRAGNFIDPTAESFSAAASNADWANAPGYYMILVDQPGDNSWPITGASFILIYKNQADQRKAQAMLSFFDWCYRSGQDSASELDYVPIPSTVYEMVEQLWTQTVVANGQPVW